MNINLKLETFKPYAKKASAILLIAAVVSGAGAWYVHGKKQERHAQKEQAWTTMITAQARHRSVTLLDESAVRSIAAEAIGQQETAITFRQISLRDMAQNEDHKQKMKHREHGKVREADSYRPQMGNPPEQNALSVPTPNDYQKITEAAKEAPAALASGETAFLPVYKVNCRVDQVKYKLRIDAVTGKVLSVKCDA